MNVLAALAVLLGALVCPSAHAVDIPVYVSRDDSTPVLDAWHFRAAVPLPPGTLRPNGPVALVDAGGKPVPCQFTVLATWHPSEQGKEAPPELRRLGGVRWLGLDFTAPLRTRRAPLRFLVRCGEAVKKRESPRPNHPLVLTDTPGRVVVDNGLINFTVKKQGYSFIDSLAADGREIIRPGSGQGVYATKEDGTVCWSANDPRAQVSVEVSGPMLAVIRAEGWHKAPDQPPEQAGFCRFVTRIYAYADVPYIKVQHTWINTEDSRKTRYGAFGIYLPAGGRVPGGPKMPALSVGDGLSFLLQDADRFEIVKSGQGTADVTRIPVGGEAGGGHFVRGPVAFAIRDFVQNYPKEIEYAPAGTWIHLWPKHGCDVVRRPTRDNLWRLWFCHEGRLLNFALPKSYHAPEFRNSIAMPQQGNGYRARAMGVAKTHEMLFVFGRAASDIRDYAAAFQADPKPMAPPEWVCNSQVLGGLSPEESEAYPDVEAYMAEGHNAYVTWRDRLKDWGMWNFGETHSAYGTNGPTAYRLMQATHYSPPTSAWLLYLRSGKPTYLTQARRNGLHIMDLDLCHYVAPDYRRTDGWFDNKAVGGLCDYKGYVHWHAGARAGYNSVVDFLWWDYYVNGNGRARDVAHEHGAYVLRKGHTEGDRSGAAVLDTVFGMYLATWDVKYWRKFRREYLRQLDYDPEAGPNSRWLWRAWWRPYLQFVDDARVQKAVLECADFFPNVSGIQADAYRITGHPVYLRRIQDRLKEIAYSRYNPPRSDLWYTMQNGAGGCDGMVGYKLRWLFNTKRLPYAMAALQQADPKPGYDVTAVTGRGACQGRRGVQSRLLMLVHNPEGKPLDIACRLTNVSWYSVVDPAGRVVAFRSKPEGGRVRVPAPHGTKGLYAVWFASPGEVWCCPSPGTVRLAFVAPRDGHFHPIGPAHVMVPKGTRRFVVSYRAHWNGGYRSTFNLVDPSGATRTRVDLPPGKSGRVEIAPAPEETGRTWMLAGARYELVGLEGIPELVTPSAGRMIPLDTFGPYLRRLREDVLPRILAREKQHLAREHARDQQAMFDPDMDGVGRFLHSPSQRAYRKYGVLKRWFQTRCTEQRPGQYLEWETRPVPAQALTKPAYTFHWIGDMEGTPRPPRPNFTLSVNGRPLVPFSVASQSTAWPGTGGAELAFQVRSQLRGGVQGTFRLTLPTKLLTSGKPVRLRIHAPKGDNGVWIGIFDSCLRRPKPAK